MSPGSPSQEEAVSINECLKQASQVCHCHERIKVMGPAFKVLKVYVIQDKQEQRDLTALLKRGDYVSSLQRCFSDCSVLGA